MKVALILLLGIHLGHLVSILFADLYFPKRGNFKPLGSKVFMRLPELE